MLGKTLRLGECVKVKVIIGWIVFICGAVMAGVGGVLATKSEWALVIASFLAAVALMSLGDKLRKPPKSDAVTKWTP